MTNQYIKGEERSFTIIAYPVPEIGEDYAAIFDEVIRINTLDAGLYEKVQQVMIDALDQGECVRILGKGENQTDLTVQLAAPDRPGEGNHIRELRGRCQHSGRRSIYLTGTGGNKRCPACGMCLSE